MHCTFFIADLLCIYMKFIKCWEECVLIAKWRISRAVILWRHTGHGHMGARSWSWDHPKTAGFFCIFSWQFLPYPRWFLFIFIWLFSPMCVDFILLQFWYAILSQCGLVAVGPQKTQNFWGTQTQNPKVLGISTVLPLALVWHGPSSPWAGEFGRVIRNICHLEFLSVHGHLNFL